MTEIWKDIEGHNGIHQISNLGNVRSVDHIDCYKRHRKGKMLKPRVIGRGYLQITFRNYKPIYIHRAVAKAFVPGFFDGAQVNHKDENKMNNRWDNLEWVTPSYNVNYGTRNQRNREAVEKRFGNIIEQYNNGIFVAEYANFTDAGRAIGVTRQAVMHGIKYNHTVKGFQFKVKTN